MKNLLKKGFTIVELVIVIAVIAILAAVLIPTFSNVISSANETAALQEAQSTLKAYTAYMSSQGKELADGPVFCVEGKTAADNRYFVFYKGSLHEFNKIASTETINDAINKVEVAPKIGIGADEYACDSMYQLVDPETNAKLEPFFYFYSGKPVTFEDGSEKCKIYAGIMQANALSAGEGYVKVTSAVGTLGSECVAVPVAGTIKLTFATEFAGADAAAKLTAAKAAIGTITQGAATPATLTIDTNYTITLDSTAKVVTISFTAVKTGTITIAAPTAP